MKQDYLPGFLSSCRIAAVLERVNRIPLKEDEGERDYFNDEEKLLKPIYELRSDKYELTRH